VNSDALYGVNERGLDCAPVTGDEDPAPIDSRQALDPDQRF
jgi:hypothetical protein